MAGAVARRLTIHGHVQGVFFRASVRRAARRAGAAGWAANRPEGTVEVHVEGPPDAVQAVVAFCREGPRGARVDHVDAEPAAAEGLSGFEAR